MNSLLKGNPEIGLYNRELPRGCELCRMGGKMVVFISGECGDSCYYCPVSEGRFGKDSAYANEYRVKELQDFIYESYRMNALGAGITGGDPLLHLDRVVELITLLKDEFGRSYHIHLYTTGRYASTDALLELAKAGLDEIRFHPVKDQYLSAVERALKVGIDVGLELPVIPGEEDRLSKLINWAREKGVKFVNLNELELTERNFHSLNSKGFRIGHGLAGVSGSFETSMKVLETFHEANISLHYCSSVYKDVVETRTRFIRTLRASGKPYEDITGEGTSLRAIVKSSADLSDFGEKIGDTFVTSPSLVNVLPKEKVDEIWIVEELPYGQRLSEKLVYSKSKNGQ
ncbi:Radical SAM domain protein [Metallosphaera sedula]|uniref:Radical SAM domain protein n=3 Tax=Metallosphaera TaxID=41980 RepID=A4YIP4_METS5|nr:Radical SAM domain protein [Metallosphaera sedula DSM 5348]AIM28279.1 Radical SAM domain protein [Metallosphaera sedula]BBL48309.1 7-carboxy-7-deazaguanine synthase [Metallosphaera sedula]